MVQISHKIIGIVRLALPAFTCALSEYPSESPTANVGLICSKDDPTDCYLKEFIPTADFQPIRDGQDIPPGLHVRLNVYTGEKEARLNIPMEGEEGSFEGIEIPTEQAIVVVPQLESESESELESRGDKPAMRDQVPIEVPAYDSAGKVAPPPPTAGDDAGKFEKALLNIKKETQGFDLALDDLSELSHDIYYGLELAKDGPVLEKLVCLTLGAGSEKISANVNGRDHKAASILGSAVQNNPTALKEIKKFWKIVMYPTCGLESRPKNNHFVSILRSRLGKEKDPQGLKAKITAISGLLRERKIQDDFLANKGMELLLAIFLKKGEEFDVVRMKVGQLITDNFLDDGMGARLGVWPKLSVKDSKICETKENVLADGCWEYHVGAFVEKEPQKQWAKDFLAAIESQRAKNRNPRKDREL